MCLHFQLHLVPRWTNILIMNMMCRGHIVVVYETEAPATQYAGTQARHCGADASDATSEAVKVHSNSKQTFTHSLLSNGRQRCISVHKM